MSGTFAMETRNPDFPAHEKRYAVAIDLYEGGERMEDGSRLIRHAWEPERQFAIRKERATYTNYAAPIVDVFGSAVCDKRPAPVLPEALIRIQNVDCLGRDRESFFQEVVRVSAGHGARFVLVEGPKKNRSEPYFLQVDALNLIDWQLGNDGALDWAVVRETVCPPREPFTPAREEKRYVAWKRTNWTRYDEKAAVIDSGDNPLGEVPIVPFLFEPTSSMTGLSVIDEVAALLIRIFRRESELDKQLFDAAVALLVGSGVDKPMMEEFVRSSWSALSIPADANMYYVETSGSSFDWLEKAISRDVAAVREISLRQVRPVSGVGESAEAKKLDNKQLDCQLAKFARQCKSAEEKCWHLAAKWMRFDAGAEDISTPYNESYDTDGLNSAVTDLLLRLRQDKEISRETLLSHPDIRKALPDDFDLKEEEVRLVNEGREQVGPGGVGTAGLADLARQALVRAER